MLLVICNVLLVYDCSIPHMINDDDDVLAQRFANVKYNVF